MDAIYPCVAGLDVDCAFTGNQAVGGAGGAGAAGGQGSGAAILGDRGNVTIRDCTFTDNQALGGAGGTNGAGGAAVGGALRAAGRDGAIFMLVTDSTFTGNSALGGTAGSGAAGGLADGGAIANVQTFADTRIQTLALRDCVLQDNAAIGGAGVFRPP
jgi:hypothetical protein